MGSRACSTASSAAGYVDRAADENDARVTYAVLADEGYEKLRDAAPTHVGGIRELFGDRFSRDELEALAELLGRLPSESVADESCEP